MDVTITVDAGRMAGSASFTREAADVRRIEQTMDELIEDAKTWIASNCGEQIKK
jgi:hypothetical protein